MSALDFYLTANRDVVELELFEISHPNFTQAYRRVRNARDGVTVLLEDGVTEAQFEWYPLEIVAVGEDASLDTGFRINFGDLGEILPREVDAVMSADGMATKPVVVYRTYRSDDLTAPLIGPLTLDVKDIAFNAEGAMIEAMAPYVNLTHTGETYNLTRFHTLEGYTK